MIRSTKLSGYLALGVALFGSGCADEDSATETPSVAQSRLGGAGLVVNECSTGTSGWIELYNDSTATIDLAQDSARCWYVDDSNGGGAPKRVTDANVNHAAGSTTCSAAGRTATCGLIGSGERVWIAYSYVNSTTADSCRLINSTLSGTTCGTDYTDLLAGGNTTSSAAGQCFGRRPDGQAWQSTEIPCTKGTSNGPCEVGAACDDANACTTGESWSTTCSCGGGTAISCEDANPCTADSCDPVSGCGHVNVPDGTVCASGSSCVAGVCTLDPATGGGGGQAGAGGQAGSGGSGGTSGSGGSGGSPTNQPAEIVSVGAPDRLLLRGTIVTETEFFVGEVLVQGDTIACVATSCSDAAQGGASPTIIDTHGIVMPGLIDTHNHILFDIFDESDWSPPKLYTNHDQWPNDARYKAMVDAKQYLNGEYGSTVSLGCELDKYGELKGLIAGTTSIVGAANPANRICYGSLARTIDQGSNDLPDDKVQVATLFPTKASADSTCSNLVSGDTESYLVHIGEGVDATALNEFDKLWTVPTTDGCLHAPQTAVVHGTAFGQTQLASMASHGMSLIWSPRSNVFLYGLGTDLTKTTNVPLARQLGINVALAPDWSIGGSVNLLDELRFAATVDDSAWQNVLTSQDLFRMVTINAARALALDGAIGSIAVGKKADLFVIGGDSSAPYDALLAATPSTVRMVTVGGKTLYGDPQLASLGPASPACETLSTCGASKFVCVAEAGGTASNKLGQTLSEIVAILGTELSNYDNMNLSAWDFSPIAPLAQCGPSGS